MPLPWSLSYVYDYLTTNISLYGDLLSHYPETFTIRKSGHCCFFRVIIMTAFPDKEFYFSDFVSGNDEKIPYPEMENELCRLFEYPFRFDYHILVSCFPVL